jgi:hypothetical protein
MKNRDFAFAVVREPHLRACESRTMLIAGRNGAAGDARRRR